jgi:hypothetical protein
MSRIISVLKKLQVGLFFTYYLIPLITIWIKLMNGDFETIMMEIWFLMMLIIITIISLILPVQKYTKKVIRFSIISIIVLFFGLGAIGFVPRGIYIDFSEYNIYLRVPYFLMFVSLWLQLIILIMIHIKYDDNLDKANKRT